MKKKPKKRLLSPPSPSNGGHYKIFISLLLLCACCAPFWLPLFFFYNGGTYGPPRDDFKVIIVACLKLNRQGRGSRAPLSILSAFSLRIVYMQGDSWSLFIYMLKYYTRATRCTRQRSHSVCIAARLLTHTHYTQLER